MLFGLKHEICVLKPVPIPCAPFTSIIGIIGKYHSGSIIVPSSSIKVKRGSSSFLKIYLVYFSKYVNIFEHLTQTEKPSAENVDGQKPATV